jgi:dTDP-4-amino-4,6-dideoxygalactose transaminase
VEDCAESIGSFFKHQHTGNAGQFGILSFNGNKTITTGGGGMIVTNNDEHAQKAKHLTTQAKISHQWEFIHDAVAYNFRLPNINAALGCAQMEYIDEIIQRKRALAKRYASFFESTEATFIQEPENSKSNYWLNTILFNNLTERNKFLEYSNSNNVMTRPAWHLLNELPMYRSCEHDALVNSKWLYDRIVNIPSSINYII